MWSQEHVQGMRSSVEKRAEGMPSGQDLDLRNQKDIQVKKAGYAAVTPLLIAAEKGHEKVVELLLNREDIRVCQARIDGHTPMAMGLYREHN